MRFRILEELICRRVGDVQARQLLRGFIHLLPCIVNLLLRLLPVYSRLFRDVAFQLRLVLYLDLFGYFAFQLARLFKEPFREPCRNLPGYCPVADCDGDIHKPRIRMLLRDLSLLLKRFFYRVHYCGFRAVRNLAVNVLQNKDVPVSAVSHNIREFGRVPSGSGKPFLVACSLVQIILIFVKRVAGELRLVKACHRVRFHQAELCQSIFQLRLFNLVKCKKRLDAFPESFQPVERRVRKRARAFADYGFAGCVSRFRGLRKNRRRHAYRKNAEYEQNEKFFHDCRRNRLITENNIDCPLI